MQIHVGTSGWSYREWKGSFYPPKLPAGAMLRHYASCFSTVEVNNSFYKLPSDAVLSDWAAQVSPEFKFVMKASRRITHNQRLLDRDGSLEYFLRAISPLAARLGPTLFQLPPSFERDPARLGRFLERLPRGCPAAMEFRHDSWFTDEIFELLRAHDIALVAVDEAPGDGAGAPLVVTSSWGYLRMRRIHYDRTALREWADRIRRIDWTHAFMFFKHEDGSPVGPAAALEFKHVLADR